MNAASQRGDASFHHSGKTPQRQAGSHGVLPAFHRVDVDLLQLLLAHLHELVGVDVEALGDDSLEGERGQVFLVVRRILPEEEAVVGDSPFDARVVAEEARQVRDADVHAEFVFRRSVDTAPELFLVLTRLEWRVRNVPGVYR